jgi:hypothetical protein
MKEMTCGEFDEVVHGFVYMELLDVTVREAALEHAAHCALCSERMADAAALAEASEEMADRSRGEQAPPQVEVALLAAFRSHHRRASWRRTLEWASLGAAAAVLLLFLWTGNGRTKGQSTSTPRKDFSSQAAIPVEAKVSESTKQVANIPGPSAATQVADASTNESYAASDFVPVPYTGAIAADDPGMVVRVQLTRASLAQLGYPVAETPDEDLILADVLVGEDGWPRGVKLIQ